MNILLKKSRKCSIISYVASNQDKDGNISTFFDIRNTIQKKFSILWAVSWSALWKKAEWMLLKELSSVLPLNCRSFVQSNYYGLIEHTMRNIRLYTAPKSLPPSKKKGMSEAEFF